MLKRLKHCTCHKPAQPRQKNLPRQMLPEGQKVKNLRCPRLVLLPRASDIVPDAKMRFSSYTFYRRLGFLAATRNRIVTSKRASHHSGVPFLRSALARDLRTRPFTAFRPSRSTNVLKNTAFCVIAICHAHLSLDISSS